uniref:Uncharacterized protein n=1 Tax=Rangifer tarandus platyrhynchus TaxID=3082113 RepID=A0ACB0DPU5_RANTA|nr:unnamed protein product [Rangifer tarandus platyrhynchus]
MTRSAVEHRSASICLPSQPVCCCEGSPGPAESDTPEVGFSSEPSLGSLWGRGAFRPSDDRRRAAEMSDAWSCTMFEIDSQSFAYDQATFCVSLMECGIPDFKGKGRSPCGSQFQLKYNPESQAEGGFLGVLTPSSGTEGG